MKTKKKHLSDRSSIQELTKLFEDFNEIYNNNFFMLTIPKNKNDESNSIN